MKEDSLPPALGNEGMVGPRESWLGWEGDGGDDAKDVARASKGIWAASVPPITTAEAARFCRPLLTLAS